MHIIPRKYYIEYYLKLKTISKKSLWLKNSLKTRFFPKIHLFHIEYFTNNSFMQSMM